MINVNDKGFRYFSMPVHNPYYKQASEIHFSADIYSFEYKAERPEVIAGIVPRPMVYMGDGIRLLVNMVKELKSGFPEDCTVWNEITIMIPVTCKNYRCEYICEAYCSDVKMIVFDREVLGFPRLPGHVSAVREGKRLTAKLTDFSDGKGMIGLSFVPSGLPPERQLGAPPKRIFLKYIPSSDLSDAADVKKIVEMKYGRPLLHDNEKGTGSIEFLEKAPEFLREAGIRGAIEANYLYLDIHILGASVLHNYI